MVTQNKSESSVPAVGRSIEVRQPFQADVDPQQPVAIAGGRQPGKADVRVFYQRHLPHQVPPGYPTFLTWNLKGSLPQRAIEEIEREQLRLTMEPTRPNESSFERKVRHGKILFAIRDQKLDTACAEAGVSQSPAYPRVSLERLTYQGRPMWLRDPEAAQIVVESVLWGVPERYALYAFAVLGNHVHVLLTPTIRLEKITQGIKGFTAYQINQLQQERGRTFWQDESYDHWARDEDEIYQIIQYIEANPVVVGLCQCPADWRWSSAAWRDQLGWKVGEPFRAEWKSLVVSA